MANFVAGEPRAPGAGRKIGTPNKTTALLKDMILAALEGVGGQKYLMEQAHKNPGPFLTLVGKVLPMQVTGSDGGSLVVRWERDDKPKTIEGAVVAIVDTKESDHG